ncbi:MAG: type II toxin-antitoxin system HicA family toxin [Chloroflexota bacterium]|nr:MAG: type II toxin-antitoxin system HicA family toxin [Chloroflexota bacterium]
MPPLPRVSGKQVVRALKHVGFEEFDHSGSHVYLHKWVGDRWSERVTVPVHGNKILKLKTLKSILKQANLSVDDLIALL